jgi:hypothetical protein
MQRRVLRWFQQRRCQQQSSRRQRSRARRFNRLWRTRHTCGEADGASSRTEFVGACDVYDENAKKALEWMSTGAKLTRTSERYWSARMWMRAGR